MSILTLLILSLYALVIYDITKRADLSKIKKGIAILLVMVIPFFGIAVYYIAFSRPRLRTFNSHTTGDTHISPRLEKKISVSNNS